MPYRARYRFKLLSPLTVDVSGDIAISIPGLPVANLEIGANAYPFGQWAVLKMSDFATEKEARVAGERLGDILLVAGAVTMTGIDIGFSQTTLQFSQDIHDAVKAVDGKILRAETHGLMVYKENTVKIVGIDARGSALIASDALERRLEMSASLVTGMTDRQRNCAALLNDSFFVPQTEGQFVLRVSAVEALCDQTDVGSDYQSAISKIEAFVEQQDFPSDVKTTINRSLSFQKKQSLRQSYMSKFRHLLSESDARAFDELYQKRSKLVHDGRGRGNLLEASNKVLNLAVSALEADLTYRGQR